jgi:hypothetical protein
MTRDPFCLSARIPSDTPADVRVRIALALHEAAVDHALALQWQRFEQSLVDNDCPADQLADLLLWSHEHFQQERARLMDEARVQIAAEVAAWCAPDEAPPVMSPPSDTETVH